jgi:molybdopterin molybdotransferase
MIELEKALELTARYPVRGDTVSVPLKEALGRVLAEDVFADRDMPPFARSTMDGYACRKKDLPGPLMVMESIPAGTRPSHSLGKGQCSKIMTGGMVPEGANCVIMQEYVKTEEDGKIMFTAGETDSNIHDRGVDLKQGDLLIPNGTRLTPGHLGNISSTGRLQIKVASQMDIGILATGSELVSPDQVPQGAQIRNSNSQQLAAQIRRSGHVPKNLGIVEDQSDLLVERISEALEQLDLLILTGGASVGEMDLVPGVLEDLGLRLEFSQVAIQPGKPVTFAHRGGDVCFGLSGNPVSSFVQFELLVLPYLEVCSGASPANKRIRLFMETEYRRHRTDRQFFLPVCFTENGGCEPVDYHGSGHLHALAKAAGLAEMPPGQNLIAKGELVYVRLL